MNIKWSSLVEMSEIRTFEQVSSRSFERPKSDQNSFGFETLLKAKHNCSRTSLVCPKSERIRILALYCIIRIKYSEHKISDSLIRLPAKQPEKKTTAKVRNTTLYEGFSKTGI